MSIDLDIRYSLAESSPSVHSLPTLVVVSDPWTFVHYNDRPHSNVAGDAINGSH